MLKRSPGFEKVQAVGPRAEGMYSNHYCEMFALPFALHAAAEDFAVPGGYLSVSPELVSAWSGVIRKPGRLSVAFAWGTGGDTAKDRRGIGLATMLELFDIEGIDFYSIQNTAARAALSRFDLPPTVSDLGIVDLDHMAAIMKNADLVILPDCGLSHLAGAIGANLWLAAHKWCDWRWRTAGWYPTARIFRQEDAGDWRPAIAQMRSLLVAAAESAHL
jgi:hypothetical protein